MGDNRWSLCRPLGHEVNAMHSWLQLRELTLSHQIHAVIDVLPAALLDHTWLLQHSLAPYQLVTWLTGQYVASLLH